MKCLLFLHSTTGNTRLVARFAAQRIREAGHECVIHDITSPKPAPDLAGVDLVGFACPTMYWRPTVAMERFVARMPNAGAAPRPVFQLATAGGDPGAHFALLGEQLEHKGWLTLGAYFVPMVNNWPPHRALAAKLPFAERLVDSAVRLRPSLSAGLSMLWPDAGEPMAQHRDKLVTFLGRILEKAERGDLSDRKPPAALWKGNRAMYATGRLMTVQHMRRGTGIRIDASQCNGCGICVKLCPVGCLTQDAADAVPAVGAICTGCWTCHNRCPELAISGFGAPAGAGRYPGPSAETRELFRG